MLFFMQLFSSDPAAWIRTGLRVVHFCGLVFGVGAATLLDFIIARFVIMRCISSEHIHIVDFSSKIVTVGLGLLWISGIGFLLHYGVVDPVKLQNPKIWAKIAIVAVLTVNGILVHHFVLPRIRNQVGKRLLDGLSQFHVSLLILAGTVSAISWYVPLMLGAIPQLNYVVPAEMILVSYALVVLAVNTFFQAVIVLFLRGYSIPVISDRSKMNMLRGSFALMLALMCGSLFLNRSIDDGAALAGSATNPHAGESKPLAFQTAEWEPVASRRDRNADVSGFESEPSYVGALRESAVTAVWQNEEGVTERTVLVSATSAAEQELSEVSRTAVGIPTGSRSTGPQQEKSGFVGLWAADARACEVRTRTKSDLLTVIGEGGARAGEHSCVFKNAKQTGDSEWEMKATCADGSARWESNVRLSVSKSKLKWSSGRGTQTYHKCTGDLAVAQANNL